MGGPIIPPVGKAASGLDDAEMERACGDDFLLSPRLPPVRASVPERGVLIAKS